MSYGSIEGESPLVAGAGSGGIGGGIGGMRAALDLADSGLKVFLVEQTPCLGGRVAQLGFMFPQHDCVLCRGTPDHGYGCTRPSISPAYIHHNQHPNIEILTNTHVIDVAGQARLSFQLEGSLPTFLTPDREFDFKASATGLTLETPDIRRATADCTSSARWRKR